MNKLSTEKRTQVVAALVEGNSIRSVCRMTGVAKVTVLKLLADLGKACARYHDEHVRGLNSKRIQCDEIWSFCYAKEKNVPEEMRGKLGFGDVWTWVAIDADSKLIASWLVGERTAAYARKFIDDLASRLRNRIQLTSDGLRLYLTAVEQAFGADIDYAMLDKLYTGTGIGSTTRYSPGECCGTIKKRIKGNPDTAHVSTSYIERQNLTMRMCMRRFTRLTNAFSKKMENHVSAIALHYLYYNFAKVHQTLRVTPAMEAGISDHVWSIQEVLGLLESN